MKYILILILHILCFSILKGETLIGLSNIRTAPNEDPILILYDGVEINCSKPSGNWVNIIVSVKASKSNFENHFSLKKGDKLFDWNNKEIGIAIKDIPMKSSNIWSSGGAAGNPERFGIDIYCCVNNFYINPQSIVENQVLNIFENDSFPDLNSFNSIIKDFKFNLTDNLKLNYSNIIEYSILDLYYDAPSDRIRLIFDDKKLIAVVFTREIKFKVGKVYDLINDKRILILNLPNSIKLNEFIENNIRSYDSKGRD
jgi:hypothetical protein